MVGLCVHTREYKFPVYAYNCIGWLFFPPENRKGLKIVV